MGISDLPPAHLDGDIRAWAARQIEGMHRMAKQRTTFAKLQRERAKAAKKAEKQAARISGNSTPAPEPEPEVDSTIPEDELAAMTTVERLFAGKGRLSAPELMSMTETIQRMHQRGEIDDEELEDAKLELLERIE